jgi:hypothetical protein
MTDEAPDAVKAAVDRLRGILRFIWKDNDEDEALEQWRQRVQNFPDAAADDLAALDIVGDNPPADLPQILEEDGWVGLYRDLGDRVEPLPFEEQVAWLRDMTARFRGVYESERADAR